jgi:predicted RNase H-like nuclease
LRLLWATGYHRLVLTCIFIAAMMFRFFDTRVGEAAEMCLVELKMTVPIVLPTVTGARRSLMSHAVSSRNTGSPADGAPPARIRDIRQYTW